MTPKHIGTDRDVVTYGQLIAQIELDRQHLLSVHAAHNASAANPLTGVLQHQRGAISHYYHAYSPVKHSGHVLDSALRLEAH